MSGIDYSKALAVLRDADWQPDVFADMPMIHTSDPSVTEDVLRQFKFFAAGDNLYFEIHKDLTEPFYKCWPSEMPRSAGKPLRWHIVCQDALIQLAKLDVPFPFYKNYKQLRLSSEHLVKPMGFSLG